MKGCIIMFPKKTQEQFEKEVHDKLNNEYTIFRTT